MRVEYLRYILEIDEQHSISAAAQKLYLGQTTLSTILKCTEKELGFQIFERTRSGVRATPEGEKAMALMRSINASCDNMRNLSSMNAINRQPVSIIASPSIHCGIAMEVSRRFLEQEPDGNLYFRVYSGEKIASKIIRNDSNIGITYYRLGDFKDVSLVLSKYQAEVSRVLEDHLYLIVRKDHPLALAERISIHELQNMNIAIIPYYNVADSTFVYTLFQGKNNVYTTYPSVSVIKRAVLSQNIASILSGYAIHYGDREAIDNSQFATVLLEDTSRRNEQFMCLIHRNNAYLNYNERVALSCLENYFAELEPPPFSPEAKKKKRK